MREGGMASMEAMFLLVVEEAAESVPSMCLSNGCISLALSG